MNKDQIKFKYILGLWKSLPTYPTNEDLVTIQDYIASIITQLNFEPNAVIPDAISAQYIDNLDVTKACNVKLQITVPSNVTSNYFFQIYQLEAVDFYKLHRLLFLL